MNRFRSDLGAGAIALALFLSPALADQPASLGDAIAGGEASVALRYRYENVDQDGFRDEANASTLRLRLNYATAKYHGWSALVEFDVVEALGDEDFNSGGGTSGPDRAGFPVVADPEYSEVNQAYVQYASKYWQLKLGRQRILLDNQRFVGGVGWRQNEQTYDAVGLTLPDFGGFNVQYAWVDNVNRIFGGDVPAGDHDSSTHLLNARRDIDSVGTLSAYWYDIENDDAPGFSTRTLGLRLAGDVADTPWQYVVEYADQDDAANNPVDYGARYYRLEAGYKLSAAVTLGAGVESLGGDRNRRGSSFRTPLATLHAFNGWADQFLATPDGGLEDRFLTASGRFSGLSWQAVWHDFSAEAGGGDFGDELDLSVALKWGSRYSGLLKYADFNADAAPFVDTRKLWLMLSASF